ncbi:sensor histidine kinase [Flavobacterium zepuense]|uniref:Sensor histidine kinase n=1 Tax=Flavobacterium zepuense TaxID=2593302 RepID=A0A552UUJ7_9FLAO|nr:sensor histidine kinase [Flavobacterium zepuense]TRW21865.1 sensor histidine kinase [Flavobacterium zepuense]
MPKKTQNYLLHLLGCLLFISIPIFSSPDFDTEKNLFALAPFQKSFFSYVLLIAFFYANYLYFIPKFYFTHRNFIFFTCIVASFFIITYVPGQFFNDAIMRIPMKMPMPQPRGRPMGPGPGGPMPWPFFMIFQGGSLLQCLMVFLLSFLLRTSQRLSHMQSEKLKTEVSYLRAQINPHFLFNTLNSLYALTIEKSDAAPEAVLKLSSMMRYVVTESGRDHVALESEIAYIKNYISLQQLRMDDATAFTFTVSGNAQGRQISPLLLIPFIENAFKYGLNPEEDSVIGVDINITDTQLLLNVKNKKVTMSLPAGEESGHGVENTRQRLQYLYPNKHELLIFDTADVFEVKLTLTLV